MLRWGGSQAFPSVITVFSAPNYCGSYKNKGAVILIENDKMNIKQYKDVEQPFQLPNNLDLFSWSLPFLADKIGEMLDHLLSLNKSVVDRQKLAVARQSSAIDFSKIMQKLHDDEVNDKEKKLNRIRAKIMCVARFNLIQKKAKENAELVLKAKGGNPDGKMPYGTLLDIKTTDDDKEQDIGTFLALKKIDSENEKFPL